MADNGIGDYFISDVEDELIDDDDELISAPVVVPAVTPDQEPEVVPVAPVPKPVPVVSEEPVAAPAPQPQQPPVQAVTPAESVPVTPPIGVPEPSRESRLAAALDELMEDSHDIQAAALVSMDGFTMASALPQGMQEDRVGAMSAAILGLGERAAAELGRGQLSEVFIEGDEGYVVLIAAGPRGVLTALAQADAKLGLVLYDMKATAATIADILG